MRGEAAVIPVGIAVLVFGTVLLAATALLQRAPDQQLVAERLKEIRAFGMPREATLSLPFSQRALAPVLRSIGKIVTRFTPAASVAAVRANLLRAGDHRTDPVAWTAWKWLRTAVVAFVALALAQRVPGPSPVMLAIAAAGLAYLWPEVMLRGRIRRRQARIIREFPETLDLLTVTVEAGLGLDQALETVAVRRRGPISEEIRIYLDEVGLGGERQTALRAIGARTGVEDLVSFTASLVRAMEFGVNIANVLRVQSDEARTRRRHRIEERAYKAPVKMLFPLIFLILPAVFVAVAGPGFARLFSQVGGPGNVVGAPPGR
jgi:tight adherence protein C